MWSISGKNTAMASKKELRRQALSLRDTVLEKEREAAEQELFRCITAHPWYCRAGVLLAYKSYGSEISTDEILKHAQKAGKSVYLPKVEGESMHFYRVSPGEPLQEGYKGILEPAAKEERRFDHTAHRAEEVLMLMPGCAFDREGNRIGYGKGFYDRYLENKKELPTIAVGFLCQITEERIPAEKSDIRPMEILCF